MNPQLQVPAMRGAIGNWIYYVALLPFAVVAQRIKRTEAIHSSKLLREMIQRALTPRSKHIADYLRTQQQRFFNAIVVGVYGGEPEWHQLDVKASDLFDPTGLDSRVANSLGILTLRGDEKLFAIDGQHRVEGIKEFMAQQDKDQASALEDEVCAIFVAHSNTTSGLQKTRRLFATLNRYAKPVSLTEIIALDEDDVVAITCRDLLENHPLFEHGRVSLARGKALSPNDTKNITSLPALYQTMDTYLMQGNRVRWLRFKAVRPNSESDVRDFVRKGHAFWDKLVESVRELGNVQSLNANQPLPNHLRSAKGGDFLFRAIAFPIVAKSLRRAQSLGVSEDDFIRRFSRVPRSLSKAPWMGVLWDGANMVIGEKNQAITEGLILWMTNCDPDELKFQEAKLNQKLAEVINKPTDEVELPAKLF